MTGFQLPPPGDTPGATGTRGVDVEAGEKCPWCIEKRRHRHMVSILATMPLKD